MKQEFKTAVIYARYSSDNQTEQSIEGQMRVCNDYAKNNNIVILDSYIDRAMTGTNDNRPAFQQMLKDSNKKLWDYVLVYKLDRFSRNKYETTIHKKTLKDNGVKVLSAMENIPDTPEGIILESLLEGMNQYYSAELSQKVKRCMKETRKKGLWQGGRLRYGYKLDGRKIVIDEEQAEIVRYIFCQYAKGVYLKDIVDDLTARGVLNKGKPFALKTVYSMLRNDKYLGYYYYNNEEKVDNLYPRIIDDALYEQVSKILETHKHGKRSYTITYLLKKKIKCGYCGESVIGENGTSKNGTRLYYYKCHGKKNLRNGCQQQSYRKETLENLIVGSLIEELNKPENVNHIVKTISEYQDKMQENNAALQTLIKEQKQIENSINNILSAIEQGVITASTSKRLKDLEARQEEIEKQILKENTKPQIKLSEKEIREYYNQALELEALMLVNYLVKEVKLYNDKAEIYLNNPLPNSPDNSQGFSFYTKVKKMPEYTRNGHLKSYKNFIIDIKN